jgi:hypothetical protein
LFSSKGRLLEESRVENLAIESRFEKDVNPAHIFAVMGLIFG